MQLLSYSEINLVSGGRQVTKEEALDSMAHYSFFAALFGGGASGLYGLCTNHGVATLVGSTITIEGSFISVFWSGLAVSWVVGAAVGLGVAVYNAQ